MKKTLLSLALIFCISFAFAQPRTIKAKFIGNCGMYLTDGNTNIYFDFPYKSGAHKYMKYDDAEIDSIKKDAIFIFTHRHSDHYSGRLLRKQSGQKFNPWNIKKIENLNQTIPDFNIKAFKTSHKIYGIPFMHYSYLITWHGKKIYFSGDTGDLEAISNVKGIDWAFVNPWLFMNALEAKVKIDAKQFGIYHLYPNQKIDGEIPANIHIMLKQGEFFQLAN